METSFNRSLAWLTVAWWIATEVSSFHTPVAFRRGSTSRLYEQSEKFPLQLVLLDHYDSYTYNLYHILAELCVFPPLVLSKDFTGPLPDCDGLILSPGPGRPQHASDMGRTLQIIADSSDLPILGVCLGHQALGHVYGASVQRAPCGPVHGQVREVRHQQADALWKGISSPLSVVRYHSLVVENLQDSPLIATAWCEEADGTRVLMGLSHPTNPHYGVQFHPESIGTEQGKELLRNFCLICIEKRTRVWKPPLQTIQPNTTPRISKNEPMQYQVWIHKITDSLGVPSNVFEELYGNATHALWLDSSSSDMPPQTKLSRISIMAANDGPLSQRIEYYGEEHQEGGLFVTDINGETNDHNMDILSYLEGRSVGIESVQQLSSEFERTPIDETDLPFDYRGGFLGYLGYEVRHDTRRFLEQAEQGRVHMPMERSQSSSYVPTAAFLFCDQSIVYDHWKQEYLIGVTMKGMDPSGLIDWMKGTARRLRGIGEFGSKTTLSPQQTSASSADSSPSFSFLPNRSRRAYEKNIAQCHEEIRNGETYELCLTNQLEVQVSDGKPLNLYHILRKRNPAPFAAFVRFDSQNGANFSICCSSPERFVSVKRTPDSTELVVEAKPIKGTAPRPRIPEGREATDAERLEDTRRAQELEESIKNRAENLMIVDLLRNDLSRVCEIGSVQVPKLMSIESYATVHQMVSTIRGRLDPLRSNSVDVLKACFPGGSMTGAPKLRTMDILHEMEEGVYRGPYSGCLGYLSLNGCMDMNIVIRSAVVVPSQRQRGWDISIGAGGAITALSESNDEYEEMLLKASAIMEAVQEWEKEAKLCSNTTQDYSLDRITAEIIVR
jgi:para-aminobenzoate synthetase